MRSSPLVTAIINNYNYDRFLSDSIDSVLNQTYKNMEIIVVDDGSTDGSREIIAGYKRRIIAVFKENGGQVSAFKEGFLRSHGHIICFLDSDDYWMPQKVERVVEIAASQPAATLIYHRVQTVDANARPFGKPTPHTLLQGNIANQVAKSGGYWAYPPTSALAFRREYLGAVMDLINNNVTTLRMNGGAPEENSRLCADAYLADLVPFYGEVVGSKDVLAAYRQHGSNCWNHSRRQQGAPECLSTHLRFYETRVWALKRSLNALGISADIDLRDHWGYQRMKRGLGISGSMALAELSWKALWLPFEPSYVARLKLLVHLWCDKRPLVDADRPATSILG